MYLRELGAENSGHSGTVFSTASQCRKDGSCAGGLRDRAFAVAGFALTKQEMRDIDALTAPDAVPCLFSKACNPDLGTGNAADPLRKT